MFLDKRIIHVGGSLLVRG